MVELLFKIAIYTFFTSTFLPRAGSETVSSKCEVREGCYHLHWKSPWCGRGVVPADVKSYKAEVQVSGCSGWSERDLEIRWQEVINSGRTLEFDQCRNSLQCEIYGSWIRHHSKHKISVQVKLPKMNQTVGLQADLIIKDLTKLKPASRRKNKHNTNYSMFQPNYKPISNDKVNEQNKKQLWGKVDRAYESPWRNEKKDYHTKLQHLASKTANLEQNRSVHHDMFSQVHMKPAQNFTPPSVHPNIDTSTTWTAENTKLMHEGMKKHIANGSAEHKTPSKSSDELVLDLQKALKRFLNGTKESQAEKVNNLSGLAANEEKHHSVVPRKGVKEEDPKNRLENKLPNETHATNMTEQHQNTDIDMDWHLSNERHHVNQVAEKQTDLNKNEDWQMLNEQYVVPPRVNELDEWQLRNEEYNNKSGGEMKPEKGISKWHLILGHHNNTSVHGDSEWSSTKQLSGEEGNSTKHLHLDIKVKNSGVNSKPTYQESEGHIVVKTFFGNNSAYQTPKRYVIKQKRRGEFKRDVSHNVNWQLATEHLLHSNIGESNQMKDQSADSKFVMLKHQDKPQSSIQNVNWHVDVIAHNVETNKGRKGSESTDESNYVLPDGNDSQADDESKAKLTGTVSDILISTEQPTQERSPENYPQWHLTSEKHNMATGRRPDPIDLTEENDFMKPTEQSTHVKSPETDIQWHVNSEKHHMAAGRRPEDSDSNEGASDFMTPTEQSEHLKSPETDIQWHINSEKHHMAADRRPEDSESNEGANDFMTPTEQSEHLKSPETDIQWHINSEKHHMAVDRRPEDSESNEGESDFMTPTEQSEHLQSPETDIQWHVNSEKHHMAAGRRSEDSDSNEGETDFMTPTEQSEHLKSPETDIQWHINSEKYHMAAGRRPEDSESNEGAIDFMTPTEPSEHIKSPETDIQWHIKSEKHHMAAERRPEDSESNEGAREFMTPTGQPKHIKSPETDIQWHVNSEKHHMAADRRPEDSESNEGESDFMTPTEQSEHLQSPETDIQWHVNSEKHHMAAGRRPEDSDSNEGKSDFMTPKEKSEYMKSPETDIQWHINSEKHHMAADRRPEDSDSTDEGNDFVIPKEQPPLERSPENDIQWHINSEKHHMAAGSRPEDSDTLEKETDSVMSSEQSTLDKSYDRSMTSHINSEKHSMPLAADKLTEQNMENADEGEDTTDWVDSIKDEENGVYSQGDALQGDINQQMASEKHHLGPSLPDRSAHQDFLQSKTNIQNSIQGQILNEHHQPTESRTKGHSILTNIKWQAANEKHHLNQQNTPQALDASHQLDNNLNWNVINEKHFARAGEPRKKDLRENLEWQMLSEKHHPQQDVQVTHKNENVRHPSSKPIEVQWHTDYMNNDRDLPHHRQKLISSGKVYRIYDPKKKTFREFCVTKDGNGVDRYQECGPNKVNSHPAKVQHIDFKIKSSSAEGETKTPSINKIEGSLNETKILTDLKADILKLFHLLNLTEIEVKTLEKMSNSSADAINKEAERIHALSPDGKFIQAKVGDYTGDVLKVLFNNTYLAAKKALGDSHFTDMNSSKGFQLNNPESSKQPLNHSETSPPHWSIWGAWSSCSVTCGIGGIERRFRDCIHGPEINNTCQGNYADVRACRNHTVCPGASNWAPWNPWSHCSATCGHGYSMRNRSCERSVRTTEDCQGQRSQVKPCSTTACVTTTPSTSTAAVTAPKVVVGLWMEWGRWSHCSAPCGLGNSTRHRICGPEYLTRLFPKTNVTCTGQKEEIQPCIIDSCDIGGAVHKVIEGDDTILHCDYDHNAVDPRNIYWITPSGRKITHSTPSDRYEVIDGSLQVKNTQRRDQGTYHCVVVGEYTSHLATDAEIDVTTCRSDPCHNGATCLEEKLAHHRHVKCICSQGYQGKFCQRTTGPSQQLILVVSLSIVVVALAISGIVTSVICCRGKRNVSIKVPKNIKDKLPPKEKTKQNGIISRGSNSSKKFKKIESCPEMPTGKNSKKNTSVVSSDDSFLEINERDYKHFHQDHIYDMYVNVGMPASSSPAVIKDAHSTSGKKSTDVQGLSQSRSFEKRRTAGQSKKITEKQLRSNSQNDIQKNQYPKEGNIYENIDHSAMMKSRYPVNNLVDEGNGGFHVSFQDKEFERYHNSVKGAPYQFSTPLKDEETLDAEIDLTTMSRTYEDFEMIHHVQNSPADFGYASMRSEWSSDRPRVHTYNRSNNEYRSMKHITPTAKSQELQHFAHLQSPVNISKGGTNKTLEYQAQSPYVFDFDKDEVDIPHCLIQADSDLQCKDGDNLKDSIASQMADCSYQHSIDEGPLVNFHGEKYSVEKNDSDQLHMSASEDILSGVEGMPVNKSPFTLDLGDLLDNFCEPIGMEVSDTSSSETVHDTVRQTQVKSADTDSAEREYGRSAERTKDTKHGGRYIDIDVLQCNSDRFYSADDISLAEEEKKGNLKTTNLIDSKPRDHNVSHDTKSNDTVSPAKDHSFKSPRERMCLDHFQMVYGSVSYKSPRSQTCGEDDICHEQVSFDDDSSGE